MHRTILFRGKRLDNSIVGEFVYGDLIQYELPENRGIETYILTQAEVKRTLDLGGRIECDLIEVEPSTVGQYTGLSDRHGKMIFEEDILDCGDRIVNVKWHTQCGTWDSGFMRYTDKPLCSNGITPVEWKYRAEIIGNVHDNPGRLPLPENA